MPRKRNPKAKLAPMPQPSPSPSPPLEPYPDLPNPTPDQCLSVRDRLLALHGFPEDFARYRRGAAASPNELPPETVLDGLVSTLLSQNTTDSNSKRAFLNLKSAFPTWQQVLDAEPKRLEDAIRCGGLAATKAARIRSILKGVREKRGEICLEYLRGLSVAEVKTELARFKGVGPKTVACVLMFQLQQEDFPVDTHVFRITKAIGWVPFKSDREKAYLHLNKRIPDELKFDLNCLLVTHGKLCERCVAVKRGNLKTLGPQSSCPLDYVVEQQESHQQPAARIPDVDSMTAKMSTKDWWLPIEFTCL